MGKIRNIMLWLMAVITFVGCAASRKATTGIHEERQDSMVTAVMDSAAKSEVRTDSTAYLATEESHTSGTMNEKGRGEETIQERVTESTDAQGNKTITTNRTIHRKCDYERNATYEAKLKHQEEIISRMQHTIDSLVLSKRLDADIHWVKKDSTNVLKEKNTKDINPTSERWQLTLNLVIIFAIIFCGWLYNKK